MESAKTFTAFSDDEGAVNSQVIVVVVVVDLVVIDLVVVDLVVVVVVVVAEVAGVDHVFVVKMTI